jgi:hypothetical protein
MKSLIDFLDRLNKAYQTDKKTLIKNLFIAAIICIAMLYLQYVFSPHGFTHIYNNITNFAYALLFYIIIDAVNSHKNALFEGIKNTKILKVLYLLIAYLICIVPSYIISEILPNQRFFATPIIRPLSLLVLLILVTIFEIFTVNLTLNDDKNFFEISINSLKLFKKTALQLTLLKLCLFMILLAPAFILFVLGSVISEVIALIFMLILPLAFLPVYAFCSNELIKGKTLEKH